MAWSRNNKRQSRALSTPLEKGVVATGMGVAFLIAPLFLGSSLILKSVETGLRMPGWLALCIGLVLLGIHFVLKSKAEGAVALPIVTPIKREPIYRQNASNYPRYTSRLPMAAAMGCGLLQLR